MKIFYIDLFAGAGGTTTGIHLSNKNIEVVACVNHDAVAIKSHEANHPNCNHFTEDVRDLDVIRKLATLVAWLRHEYPGCVINLWASLECTNYSKAKGGLPRDADSRTLAYILYDYIEAISPDYVMIENVREFMSWGPLDENGKPVSKLKGVDYIDWVEKMQSYGYDYDWRMLNSADFGAYTSRDRYFGQFAKEGLQILWPKPTHSKKPEKTGLKKWRAVKKVLDLFDEGQSIFNRKRPYVESTLKRIYDGLVKFVANGDNTFLTSYYGNSLAQSSDNPCPTLTTKDRVTTVFIDQQYGQSKPVSADQPLNTITANPKFNLVNTTWLLNPQFSDKGRSIENPCFTLIARMDKKPPYLVNAVSGGKMIDIYYVENPTMVKIKHFMNQYGISDIKMRGLKVPELLKIQGFPEGYILKGTQTDQKKFIGNSVVPLVATKIVDINHNAITYSMCA